MDIFFEIHKDIPREGPGERESTKQAISMLKDLPKSPKILDIGCGPGMQTIELALNTDGEINAIDTHEPFLEVLRKKISAKNLTNRVEIKNCSMFELDFEKNSFDLIWSEGAIYIIGFKKGLHEWRKYLIDGGYLVVSEISWLQKEVPEEPKIFWETDYPEICRISEKIKIIEDSGYTSVGHFILPKSGWWNDYYNPLLKRIKELKVRHKDNEAFIKLLDDEKKEIALYEKYSDYYGYVFYLMKRV